MLLNIASIKKCTESEGIGKRFAIWTQGCLKKCKNCCNSNMQPFIRKNIIDSDILINDIRISKEKYKSSIKFENENNAYSSISKSVNIENGGRGVLNILESKIINPLSNFIFENMDSIQGRTIKIVQLNENKVDFDFKLE